MSVVVVDGGLTCDGAVDRAAVGGMVGALKGVVDGIELGMANGAAAAGNMEGVTVGDATGNALGVIIDDDGAVGAIMAIAGALVGMARGVTDGAAVGMNVGGSVGSVVGTSGVEGRREDGFRVCLVGLTERVVEGGPTCGVVADGTAAGRRDGGKLASVGTMDGSEVRIEEGAPICGEAG